ncbi:MAG: thioredoxin [Spirochaetota bacterium]|nr:thioredoxin [Spirochaetota bacterium]
MSTIMNVTEETFEDEVMKSNCLTIADFWADWCGPCHVIGKLLDELADSYDGQLKIVKVDFDENQKLSGKMKISGLPTLLFVKDGEVVERVMGAQSRSLINEKIMRLL